MNAGVSNSLKIRTEALGRRTLLMWHVDICVGRKRPATPLCTGCVGSVVSIQVVRQGNVSPMEVVEDGNGKPCSTRQKVEPAGATTRSNRRYIQPQNRDVYVQQT